MKSLKTNTFQGPRETLHDCDQLGFQIWSGSPFKKKGVAAEKVYTNTYLLHKQTLLIAFSFFHSGLAFPKLSFIFKSYETNPLMIFLCSSWC